MRKHWSHLRLVSQLFCQLRCASRLCGPVLLAKMACMARDTQRRCPFKGHISIALPDWIPMKQTISEIPIDSSLIGLTAIFRPPQVRRTSCTKCKLIPSWKAQPSIMPKQATGQGVLYCCSWAFPTPRLSIATTYLSWRTSTKFLRQTFQGSG